MFDRNRRGTGARPSEESGVDDELEQDRFTAPKPADSPASPPGARVREAAIIGPSIHIDGDLRGEEDLLIEGTVTGTIQMREHTLTIGGNGKVKADVFANSVFVDGSLEGDLYGSERVAIRKSGSVKGNVVSPRVSLEDGGRFKGTIEMDQQAVDSAFGKSSSPKGGQAASGGGEKAAEKPAEKPASGAAGSGSASSGSESGGKAVGGAAAGSKP